MTTTERCYRLALLAYPRDFRQTHGEEMLTTLVEMREGGHARGRLRDLLSLVWGGGRQRWLTSTGGSFAATIRQGLAWGVLILVVRQFGLAAQQLWRPLVNGWLSNDHFLVAHVLLLAAWLVTFCLLAGGSRRWGLVALTATLAGFVYFRVDEALSYPGRFDLPWTLGFFVPAVLPLLAAYAWPKHGVKLRLGWWPLWLVPVAVVGPLSMLGYGWGAWFGQLPLAWMLIAVGALVGLTAIVLGSSDPRWLPAVALLLIAYEAKEAVPIMSGRNLLADAVVPLAVVGIVVPSICLLAVRQIRKRAVRARY